MTVQTGRLTRTARASERALRLCMGNFCAALGFVVALPMPATADTIGIPPPKIYNLYGQVGLLDMPTARVARDGELGFSVSSMRAEDRYTLFFQALPWLETAFRYSRVDNYSSNFDLYDRSLSVKIRLQKETDYWPNIAIGLEDILGTGAFGAEYLVASKRFGDFDFTLGMGWRRFGELAAFSNPLGHLSSSFKKVSPDFGLGGKPSLKNYFHGPKAGLFGGVAWNTPINGLSLIVEASGDKYKRQQATGAMNYRTPVNVGLSYEPWEGLQLGAAYMYGSQIALRATLHFNAHDEMTGARLGEQPIAPKIRSSKARSDAVLALLQSTTQYYDSWPSQSPVLKSQVLPSQVPVMKAMTQQIPVAPPSLPRLADDIYQTASFRTNSVENVETYGNSLLITLGHSAALPSCNTISELSHTAHESGLDNVVLSSRGSADVLICKYSQQPFLQRASLVQFASSAEVGEPASNSNTAQPNTDALAIGTDADPYAALKARILTATTKQQIPVTAIWVTPHKVELAFFNTAYRSDAEAMGRLLRVLMANAPQSVEIFRLVSMAGGIPVMSSTFSRSDIERTLNMYGDATELLPVSNIETVDDADPLIAQHNTGGYPSFNYSLAPGYRQSLFDPNNPYRVQFYAKLNASISINRHFAFAAAAEANLYSTITDSRPSNSVLPHVRSDFAKYYTTGINGISSITASYAGKLSPEVYYLVKAGYLESMFAGAGGEIYWQPANKRWSVGASLYAVQQRNFNRLFGLQHYRVVTGHASVYYDSPFYNLDFAIHAGRYLAGDYGATFQISRRFDNGIEIGAYVTLTNVPFLKFGEGSFDKGIIIRIPISNLLPVNTQDEFNMDFSPLTRDGGQRLLGESSLHKVLQRASEGELLTNWKSVLHP